MNLLGRSLYSIFRRGDVVELVDTHALGACAERREGSSPFIRTNEKTGLLAGFSVDID